MTNIKQKVKIDAKAYESQVIERNDSKSGWFWFDNDALTVQIGFTSDEHGNVEGLDVIEALDAYGDVAVFTIDDSNYRDIADQIEPMLWGESEAQETEHGMSNSDFIYGYSA